jgi:hypothetical protein
MIPRRSLLILAGAASAAAMLGAPSAASAVPTPAFKPLSASATPAPSGAITPAEYGTFINYASKRGGIRKCPWNNNTCPSLGWANLEDPLQDFCYVTGEDFSGTPYWDLVFNNKTGVSGYVNENWLENKQQNKSC